MIADLDFLLTDEVAELLRIPTGTLRSWRASGRGPKSHKHGVRVVYRRSDVEAWVAAQEAATAQGGAVA